MKVKKQKRLKIDTDHKKSANIFGEYMMNPRMRTWGAHEIEMTPLCPKKSLSTE